MHEDTQHVWDKLRQAELELSTQSHHNLLDQKDDGVLHRVVWCPVLLQVRTLYVGMNYNNNIWSISLKTDELRNTVLA